MGSGRESGKVLSLRISLECLGGVSLYPSDRFAQLIHDGFEPSIEILNAGEVEGDEVRAGMDEARGEIEIFGGGAEFPRSAVYERVNGRSGRLRLEDEGRFAVAIAIGNDFGLSESVSRSLADRLVATDNLLEIGGVDALVVGVVQLRLGQALPVAAHLRQAGASEREDQEEAVDSH